MEILPVTPDRLPEAPSLCWNVFCQYNAPTFPLRESVLFTHTTRIISALNAKTGRLQLYAAYQESQMIGVLACVASHISLLFVRASTKAKALGRIDTLCAVFSQKSLACSKS